MQFHLIVVWFHWNCVRKRGGLLWPITRKKNSINLRWAAFFTIVVCNLLHNTYTTHFRKYLCGLTLSWWNYSTCLSDTMKGRQKVPSSTLNIWIYNVSWHPTPTSVGPRHAFLPHEHEVTQSWKMAPEWPFSTNESDRSFQQTFVEEERARKRTWEAITT